MRGAGKQDRRAERFERAHEARRREQVEQAGGRTGRQAELHRIEAVEMRVRRQAQDPIIGGDAELGRAHTRIAQEMIEGDPDGLRRRLPS